jgi:hypothetical protein
MGAKEQILPLEASTHHWEQRGTVTDFSRRFRVRQIERPLLIPTSFGF